jgi:hypothetical protein
MDETDTEALRAADKILAEYDILLGYSKTTARGRMLRHALALAYARGATVAATEAAEAGCDGTGRGLAAKTHLQRPKSA